MKHLVFLVLLATCAPAHAAQIATWNGPGPNACDGRCSFEWARTQLTPSETQQLEAVLAEQPDPGPVIVNRGDAFALMSYYKDGEPVAYRSGLVSGIDTVAQGWVVGDWAFVQLQECQNWAVVRRDWAVALPQTAQPTATPVFFESSPPIWIPPVWEPPTWIPPVWEPPSCCVVPPEEPPVTPPAVPLPTSILMLLAALGSLFWYRRA